MASISEENSEISDFEGFTEEDLAVNISVVPDSDPDSSDIEVSSVGSSDISDFWESVDENVENLNANTPNLTWTTNFGDVTVDSFEQDSGPNLPENFYVSAATPLNYFELLFKPEMFREIVTHSNNYAVFKRDETRAQKNEPDYVDNMWVNTSVDEMRAFFGMNVIMGINNLPGYKLYWHKDSFLGNAGIKQIMPVKRYEKLCQYLHVSDRTNEPNHQGNNDKLYKIWPVLTMTQNSFKECYKPGKHQAIDEAMIAFKGRLSYIQYLPAKPIKHGIKLWMRCDSESAYLHVYGVYLGRQQNSPNGLAYDVVTKLCQSIAGHNHHVYCDNYFTSIPLLKQLLQMKIYASGTVRSNKKGLPAEVKKPPQMV